MNCKQHFLVYQLRLPLTDWLYLTRLPRRLHIKNAEIQLHKTSTNIKTFECELVCAGTPFSSSLWCHVDEHSWHQYCFTMLDVCGLLSIKVLKPSCPHVFFWNWITSDQNRTKTISQPIQCSWWMCVFVHATCSGEDQNIHFSKKCGHDVWSSPEWCVRVNAWIWVWVKVRGWGGLCQRRSSQKWHRGLLSGHRFKYLFLVSLWDQSQICM